MAIDPGRVKSLFQAAIERNDPVERGAFLDREAGGDAALRGRLDALLAAYDEPPGALDRPLGDDLPTIAAGPDEARDPPPSSLGQAPTEAEADGPNRDHRGGGASTPTDQVIAGRYRLRQLIGEGGMGSVYLADQIQPVRRRVALKLVRPGMDSRQVLARFESERQALAIMDHPDIARVLDAGTSEQGRPFFVMELVKGITLTEYCDQHRLDIPARLEVFRQICSAVQHAHQKGDDPPRPEADEHPRPESRRPAGPQGPRLRPGQGDQRHAALGSIAVHRLRQRHGDAAVHGPGAGHVQRPGRRHPGRHLRPGGDPLRTAHGQHADRAGDARACGAGRDAPGDPRGRAADAVEPDRNVRVAAERRRGPARRAGSTLAAGPGATWTGS